MPTRKKTSSDAESADFEPESQNTEANSTPEQSSDQQQTAAEPADFPELTDAQSTSKEQRDQNLDLIMDIPVTCSVELGRSKIRIGNLLKLSQGSIVELDRLAGEPLDILVNGCLVAHGEVVVVKDKFGIRLLDIVSPTDRLKSIS